jgi:hypothetical protein
MSKAKACLVAPSGKRVCMELDNDEHAIIGHANHDHIMPPDCDLGTFLSVEGMNSVKNKHAALTYREQGFRLEMLDDGKVWIGPYELHPGRSFRVVDGDVLKFGDAELTLRIYPASEPQDEPEDQDRTQIES